jgi:hypothetical protein
MMLMTTPCLSNSHRLWSRSASDGTFTTQNAAFLCIGIFVFKYSTSILRFYDILWYSMIFYGCCRWSNHKNGIHGWRRITVQAFQTVLVQMDVKNLPVMCSHRRWPMPDIGLQMTWKSVVYPSRRYRCTFSMIGNQTYIMMSIKHRVQEVTMCCATADLV